MLQFPTGRRQTSWLFTKRDRGFEFGTTERQIPLVAGRRLWTRDLRITTTAPLTIILFGEKGSRKNIRCLSEKCLPEHLEVTQDLNIKLAVRSENPDQRASSSVKIFLVDCWWNRGGEGGGRSAVNRTEPSAPELSLGMINTFITRVAFNRKWQFYQIMNVLPLTTVDFPSFFLLPLAVVFIFLASCTITWWLDTFQLF